MMVKSSNWSIWLALRKNTALAGEECSIDRCALQETRIEASMVLKILRSPQALTETSQERSAWNACRYEAGNSAGHYESYFQRANHPTRPLAFWIRYTIFSPKSRPQDAIGELWAVYFDGEGERIIAVREVVPIDECTFSKDGLDLRLRNSYLREGELRGRAAEGPHLIKWSLDYSGGQTPLFLLPERLYRANFPRAKLLVGTPNAVFAGWLTLDGDLVPVDGWVGSQNHNWGSQHTDQYAWGQVAGFDEFPDAFLECATARVRLGPWWSPWMTFAVLRLEGRTYAFNSLPGAWRARARLDGLRWTLDTRWGTVRLRGNFSVTPERCVEMRYANPPGGEKVCLNSKLAACELSLFRRGEPPVRLTTQERAAFEILGDESRL
jgi:hypothetical protein